MDKYKTYQKEYHKTDKWKAYQKAYYQRKKGEWKMTKTFRKSFIKTEEKGQAEATESNRVGYFNSLNPRGSVSTEPSKEIRRWMKNDN